MSDNTSKKATESIGVYYDADRDRITLRIPDMEGIYPLLLHDPEAGYYEIKKTKNGGLLMNR
jgi:hypothetical protein